jgi:hypothetical protein
MLGNWWNEEEPTSEFFDDNPVVWEAILLSCWVLLADQSIIWEQLSDRYEELTFDNPYLNELTEQFLKWRDEFSDSGEVPEEAPDRETLPPSDWIRPLASDLIRDYSQPSFDYPESWCEMLAKPLEPDLSRI